MRKPTKNAKRCYKNPQKSRFLISLPLPLAPATGRRPRKAAPRADPTQFTPPRKREDPADGRPVDRRTAARSLRSPSGKADDSPPLTPTRNRPGRSRKEAATAQAALRDGTRAASPRRHDRRRRHVGEEASRKKCNVYPLSIKSRLDDLVPGPNMALPSWLLRFIQMSG
jgi:hypothetical protein